MAITQTIQAKSNVCQNLQIESHFEQICQNSLLEFVKYVQIISPTFFGCNFDVNVGYGDGLEFYQKTDTPVFFIRHYIDKYQKECCYPKPIDFQIHFTTSFENQKHLIQNLVTYFQDWLCHKGNKIEYEYRLDTNLYRYFCIFANNQNQFNDQVYVTEPINNYNYHTITTNITLLINKF